MFLLTIRLLSMARWRSQSFTRSEIPKLETFVPKYNYSLEPIKMGVAGARHEHEHQKLQKLSVLLQCHVAIFPCCNPLGQYSSYYCCVRQALFLPCDCRAIASTGTYPCTNAKSPLSRLPVWRSEICWSTEADHQLLYVSRVYATQGQPSVPW
jgi:hypothetical protein